VLQCVACVLSLPMLVSRQNTNMVGGRVVVWCSDAVCVAVCCSVLQRVAVCCSDAVCGALCCSDAVCVAVSCSSFFLFSYLTHTVMQFVLHGVLQCVAVMQFVVQCVAVDSFSFSISHTQ